MPFGKNKHFAFKKMYSIRQLFRAVFLIVGLICLTLGLSQLTFAEPYTEVIKSIEITSQHANYANGDPGAWKVEKSAKWIGADKARITFNVDTILKTVDASYTDIIMVIDNSGSMSGDKMSQVKNDSTELINSVLSNANNRIALVSFNTTATKLSGFTNNKTNLLNLINNLNTPGTTNYYDGFKKAEEILEGYTKQNNRELIMLFLTDGYPNEDTPNEKAEYRYLKQAYPYMTINGIQYEMGDEILQPIKDISDNQFIANMNSLNNVLFEASVAPYAYENFTITDYIDDTYWNVSSVDDLEASIGEVSLSYEGSTPKVTWVMNEAPKTGKGATLTIDVSLKSGLNLNDNTFLPTNKSETISTTLPETSNENITSTLTPVLKAKYNVSYEPNLPSGCTSYTGTLPAESTHLPFAIVQKSSDAIACEGYNFNGWEIAEGDPKIINDDYFKIVSDDVILRATWSKPSITKSMDGQVKEELIAYLRDGQTLNMFLKRLTGQSNPYYNTDNTTITAIKSAQSMSPEQQANSTDIGAYNSPAPVYAWFDDTDGTVYIYSDADVIKSDASMKNAFYEFYSLADISGISGWDTSNTTDMSNMFTYAKALTDVDALAGWNTSNVLDMQFMFTGNTSLTNLDGLANWDTSNVTNMYRMFFGDTGLTDLNSLADWNTSNVTDMGGLFEDSTGIVSLDGLANWDTSNVTDMSRMFRGTAITNVDTLADWNTSSLTTISNMFYETRSLNNIDGLANWDTSSVTDMSSLFRYSTFTDIDALATWDTSKVTTIEHMFWNTTWITNVNGAASWNTSNVTDMGGAFESCGQLSDISALANWDVSNVTYMNRLFYYNQSLNNINALSNWHTSKVTDMSSMFSSASGITNVDSLSNWNTSSVTNMSSLFNGNYSLTNIDALSGWDTSSVTNMSGMFSSASGITNVDSLSNWNTSSVTNMSNLFQNASRLTDINGLTSWNTSSVTNMSKMFYNAANLENISALSGWNTQTVTNMNQMFYSDAKITSLNPIFNWNVTNVTNMTNMFTGIPTSVTRPDWYQ